MIPRLTRDPYGYPQACPVFFEFVPIDPDPVEPTPEPEPTEPKEPTEGKGEEGKNKDNSPAGGGNSPSSSLGNAASDAATAAGLAGFLAILKKWPALRILELLLGVALLLMGIHTLTGIDTAAPIKAAAVAA
jgi:hypothetical protein